MIQFLLIFSLFFTTDAIIDTMVAECDMYNLIYHVWDLQALNTRFALTPQSDSAGMYIGEKFSVFGYDSVFFDTFTIESNTMFNVITTKPGVAFPENVYIVCGHYDSYSEGYDTLAPGADDNASGVATVLEIARVFNQYNFENTIKFIGFQATEVGRKGSKHYVTFTHQPTDTIIGVFNFDMVGYEDISPEDVDIISDPASSFLMDKFIDVCTTYTDLETKSTVDEGIIFSDHASFWENEIPGILITEDYPWVNPHRHHHTDVWGSGLNSDTLMLEITKGGVATLASLCKVIPGTGPHLVNISHLIDDENGGWEPGEEIKLILGIKNFGIDPAYGVSISISTYDSYIIPIDTVSNIGDLLPDSLSVNLEEPFILRASDNTPPGHKVNFVLNLIANGGSYVKCRELTIKISDLVIRDYYGYYAYDSTDSIFVEAPRYTWVELNPSFGGNGTHLELVDDESKLLSLPFTFKYYGEEYNFISVCSNGWIAMGNTIDDSYQNSPIPDPAGPPAMIAPYFDDLNPAQSEQGGVYYKYDTEKKAFVVEWSKVPHCGSEVFESFEVLLLDPAYFPTTTGDGEILFNYAEVGQDSTCTVGIEDYSEEDGIQYLYNGIYDLNGSKLKDELCIKFTTDSCALVKIEETDYNMPLVDCKLTCYPNPFCSFTVIRYSLFDNRQPKTDDQCEALKIYDASGRLIRTLREHPCQHPWYTVLWDGTDRFGRRVPSGIYFFRLETDEFKKTKKLVLIR